MRKLVFTIADKWLIFFLLLASLLPIIYNMLYISQPSAKTAQIRVNGQLIKTLPLRDGYAEEFRVGNSQQYAIIEVLNGKVRIREDDSPRQIGVQSGWISHPPQQIVNLPYQIVVTIVTDEPQDVDTIIR
ncbi:hypothetical protein SPFL3102_03019 [Sporomusaceae bacterium FL31]|nr:hypothetical protein SPFL3101_01025 [Sporomusaceae bacterium FL31]GCE35183.1 hypothetical protein SPFL3102_03019 [Sporomusaceae bacterium]